MGGSSCASGYGPGRPHQPLGRRLAFADFDDKYDKGRRVGRILLCRMTTRMSLPSTLGMTTWPTTQTPTTFMVQLVRNGSYLPTVWSGLNVACHLDAILMLRRKGFWSCQGSRRFIGTLFLHSPYTFRPTPYSLPLKEVRPAPFTLHPTPNST